MSSAKLSATGADAPQDLKLLSELTRRGALPRLMARCMTWSAWFRVSRPVDFASFDHHHSKLRMRVTRTHAGGCPPSKHPSVGPNAQRHMLTRQTRRPVPPQRSGAPDRRVSIGQVGMSGGICHIVLRLVETGYRATVQRCTDASSTGSLPPGDQRIDKTDGA